MSSTQWRGEMTVLDRQCVLALQAVRFGQGRRASEISHALHLRMTKGQPITVRERHALYAIAYRFRAQMRPGCSTRSRRLLPAQPPPSR